MAENKRYYWLKLKDDYFTSPKIRKLRKIAGGDTLTIIYLKMQLLTVKSKGEYEYQHIENSLEEELALILDEDADNIKLTMAFLQAQDLIDLDEQNGKLSFFEAMGNIGSECESAERVRMCREKSAERKKLLHCNGTVTSLKQSSISNSISNSNSNSLDSKEEVNSANNKNKKIFTPPTLEEVQGYADERGCSALAKTFYDYYTAGDWTDSKGNKVKNWKQKFITWQQRNSDCKDKPKVETQPEPKAETKVMTDEEREYQEWLDNFGKV